MAEKLNYEVVEGKLSSFNSSCESLYNALKELDSLISSTLGSNGVAIRGNMARSLLNDWDNNCSYFLNFKGMFDEWHTAAVDICAQNAQFEQKSVEATEKVYTIETGKNGGAA